MNTAECHRAAVEADIETIPPQYPALRQYFRHRTEEIAGRLAQTGEPLPAEHAPYAVFILQGSDGQALYVGGSSSASIKYQLPSYLREKPWFGEVVSTKVLRFRVEEITDEMKKSAIRKLRPPHAPTYPSAVEDRLVEWDREDGADRDFGTNLALGIL